MRETRYAVMALARGLSDGSRPDLLGQSRRGPGPLAAHRFARPHARRSGEPLGRPRSRPCRVCSRDHPLARSCGAARPRPRRGVPGPARPARRRSRRWSHRLADPSKIVWRAAAWALRRLGNAGVGRRRHRGGLAEPRPARPPRRDADLRLPVPRHGRPPRRSPIDFCSSPTTPTSGPASRPSRRSASGSTARPTPPFNAGSSSPTSARMADETEPVVRKNLSRGPVHHARREPRRRRQPPEEHRAIARTNAPRHPRRPGGVSSVTVLLKPAARSPRLGQRASTRRRSPVVRRLVLPGTFLRASTDQHDRRRQRPRVRIPLRAAR